MRLAARRAHAPRLEEGVVVDGYEIESFRAHRGDAELICQAVGPDGEAVSLVVAWRAPLDRHGWSRFRRSARVRAALEHDALLPVRAVGDHRGHPYLAMDRYPETTFADLLDGSPLSPQRVLTLLAPASDALGLAHARGLIHQSLSGTSLLLEGETPMLDAFGLAGGPQELSFESVGLHEARYSAPEELRGDALEPASNVYALTSLLVHALTGAPPYEGTPAARAYGHLMEPPPAPSERVPALGTAFDAVIAWGMAKDPAERPESPLELMSAAATALGVEYPAPPGSARPVSEADDSPARPRPAAGTIRIRRIPTLAVIALAAAAAIGGVAAGVAIDPFESTGSAAAGPSADAAALARLDARRTVLRARLSASDTPQEQAATAAELAEAYARAARAAESPSAVSAVREAERAYADLGVAAEEGSADEFAAASGEVARAESAVAVAVARRR